MRQLQRIRRSCIPARHKRDAPLIRVHSMRRAAVSNKTERIDGSTRGSCERRSYRDGIRGDGV